MAGKQGGGEDLSVNLAGMSKNQLYDIVSQMKSLIEQNQQQARQILIQNPTLTKALFQAQIMLGMVQAPQVVPKVQPMVLQNNQQPAQPTQQPNTQPAPLLPGHGGAQDQTGVSQTQIPLRKHHNQSSVPVSSAVPAMSHQSQPISAHSLPMPQQPKGHLAPQVALASLPQSSQLPNIPPPSLHSLSQPLHPPQMPTASSQLQQPLQSPGFPHIPMQQPLAPQIRPPSAVPTFHPQYPPQMGANLGFQHAGASHNLSQSLFHPGSKPPASVGSAFPQGQTQLPSQKSSQPPYQVGNMPLGPDFGNQAGNAMQVDRGSSMIPGPSDNLAHLSGPPGPPYGVSGPMGAANQALRPPALTPEMEKALLQQVMSLTPEQINLLPPEQRNQVLQLQQMLRH
ncbi:cleavage stimulating factor 64 [Vigna unguiculata]|uniref:Cleavage stimulation factor subunit 2 n=1 Tax=Vigna unguiculata TaxID=3917 RepID=A0A4D6N1Q3_VIGUN|nr:cleavage stimulating factor 64 [Vigna unguiculata]QCE06804.1 cleavage stimulation factor subunit 2 [Vigna unguiculata]